VAFPNRGASGLEGQNHIMAAKIDSKDYRVGKGKKVKLAEWPTQTKAICKSKQKYEELLQHHVEELNRLQRVHYASGRNALLLIFPGMCSLESTQRDARFSASSSRAPKS